MTAPHTRTEDEILAAATAGQIVAGMPPTADDVDVCPPGPARAHVCRGRVDAAP
ncbi:hypothetical protein [Gordonia paraffinivorans]|uniref:hypothetical protein n=1 Tax=Gordonia paraffinivorans TaxID=175628 RepID=UPI001E35D54C|nr:hypothetical protein [Gordonia paraffinivorans]MCD2147401.1 hypothetical protein [Gordonia paraffinivorans]